jgi:phospholipase C
VTTKPALALVGALAVAACSRTGASPSLPATAPGLPVSLAKTSPIRHVVFIVQENRSFNNFFMGYPGATTQNYGYNTHGQKIMLHAEDLGIGWDLDHSAIAFFNECDGKGKLPGTNCKMDGWNRERVAQNAPKHPAYAYVPRGKIAPYWDIAQQYVLSDKAFASNLDGSFVAHQYIIAAYASHAVDYPLTYWGCEGGKTDAVPTLKLDRTTGRRIRPCFDDPTIGSEADTAGVGWRFYTGGVQDDGGLWSSYQASRKVYYGPDWNVDVVNPPSQFLTDIGNGQLANITWITPTWGNSDHSGLWAKGGPAWVASLVDAIGTSKFWGSTAIFIMWDDWGGWFDPVAPVYEDYDGLGFRVPLIVVSPYAKSGTVTHVKYETASVLRYIEDNFGLPQLAASDTRANDPANDLKVFDYAQTPRKFKNISGGKPASYWVRVERAERRRGMPGHILGDD